MTLTDRPSERTKQLIPVDPRLIFVPRAINPRMGAPTIRTRLACVLSHQERTCAEESATTTPPSDSNPGQQPLRLASIALLALTSTGWAWAQNATNYLATSSVTVPPGNAFYDTNISTSRDPGLRPLAPSATALAASDAEDDLILISNASSPGSGDEGPAVPPDDAVRQPVLGDENIYSRSGVQPTRFAPIRYVSPEQATQSADPQQTNIAPASPEPEVTGQPAAPIEDLGPVAPDLAEVVLLEADEIEDQQGPPRRVYAKGNVIVRYGPRVLRADELLYDADSRSVYGKGNVELVSPDGTRQFADEVEVDDRLEKGVAAGFMAQLPQQGSVVAAFAQRSQELFNRLERARYTACKICKGQAPTWSLQARRATQNIKAQTITYRDALLQVKGVPVFYLPFFFHPDPTSDRRSGLLFPEIGRSTARGLYYGQPILFALSPSTDLIVKPRFFSKVNPVLEGRLVRRFYSGGINIEGSGTYERNFDNVGTKFEDARIRGNLFADGKFRISQNWDWGFAAERVSDDLYLDRYDLSQNAEIQRGLFHSESRRLNSQVYVTRQTSDSYLEVSTNFFQNLRGVGSAANTPLVGPLFIGSWRFDEPITDGRLSVTASGVRLSRQDNNDTQRATVQVDWRTSAVIGPGLVVEPYALGRGDYYRVSTVSRIATGLIGGPDIVQRDRFGRGLWSAGTEIRYPFLRPGKAFDVIVEPVLLGGWGARNGADDRIPVEDRVAFEFDESSLFRANGASGYDLFESGGRATTAIRSTFLSHNGWSGNLVFGRRWRANSDDNFDRFSNLDGTSSDYVGSANLKFGSYLELFTRARFDRQTFGLRRIDAGGNANIWRLNLSGRFLDIQRDAATSTRSREISGAAAFRLTRNWSLNYSVRRDLVSRFNVSRSAGISFGDDCTHLDFFFSETQTIDRSFGGTRSFGLRLSLATLGDFGTQR